jgi:threonine synthase
MQKTLAQLEGIWVEPASAAGLAGLALEIECGRRSIDGKRVVAVCTGHGLKDPGIVTARMPAPRVIPPEIERLEDLILAS